MDQKKVSALILLDFSKAFDSINKIISWCGTNSLIINLDKSKLILFGTPQLMKVLTGSLSLNILGKTIEPVSSARDLCVILDSHMKYDEHISKLVSSCMSKLCQINRLKHVFAQQTLIFILESLVLNKLFYCSSVWTNTTAKNIMKLQLIQNFTARIITNTNKYDHITPVLTDLGWLTVDQHLQYRDSILMFKCINDIAPP